MSSLSPGRRRLYVAITLALPWAALLLLEAGLRVGGYGGDFPLFVPFAERPEYLMPNQDVARRWFGARGFRPTAHPDFFGARKAPGTFRIVFQGESSAQGFPYGHGGAPSRMLEQRLSATFPERRIETINTALTAISSYVLLDQAGEIIDQQPDVVLIYTGHNEYYGVFGAGSAGALGRWPRLVRAYLALRRLRVVQLVERAMDGGAPAAAEAHDQPRTVMQLMAGEQRVPLGSARYGRGLDQFRANLRALLARYRASGIPVLIGTVASNERDQRPFIGAAAESAYAAARAAEARGDTSAARPLYRAAREADELRFRAPEAINLIIREEAARQGATVVETQRALEHASPGGVVGATLMLEHVHPNLDGYFLIADAFYDAMRQRGMIGPWTTTVPTERARAEIPATEVDSLAGLLRADRLTSGWPFTPRGTARTPVMDTLAPRSVVEGLALELARGTLAWPEAMERLREHHERTGQAEAALRAALALAQEHRYAAKPLADAARIALGLPRPDLAIRYAREASRREETAEGAQLAGLLLLRAGDDTAAVRSLRRAWQLAPRDRRLKLTLDAAEAIPGLERARALAPRDTAVLHNLGAVYLLTRQYDKAREALTTLLRVAPAHAGGRALLAKLPP